MKNRKSVIVAVSLILITMILGIVALKPQAQDRNEQQDEEATVVQRGQVTEKGREYSKEYKRMYPDRRGQKLGVLSEIGKRKGHTKEAGVSIGIPTIPTIGDELALTAAQFLRNLSCQSDAIVIGSVRKKFSHLTEDETFVYTDYEFSVENVVKNNPASPVTLGNTIEVIRPGGLIKLDNQVIRVEDKSYPFLQKNKQYLLFLRFVPSVNGYVVSSAEGDFILESNSFKKISPLKLPEELQGNQNPQTLLDAIRSANTVDCSRNLSGGNQ